MPPNTQASSKRVRAQTDKVQCPRDPREELCEVAGLVERRRLQNKISQRNYRNRIRDRLEALEALVDNNTAKGQTSKPSENLEDGKSDTFNRAERRADGDDMRVPQENPLNLSSESSGSWEITDYLNASTKQFNTMYNFIESDSPAENYGSKPASPEILANLEDTPLNRSSSALESTNTRRAKQQQAIGQERLDSSFGTSCSSTAESPLAHVPCGCTSSQTPTNQSNACNAIKYGYPMTPLSGLVQPLTPTSFPSSMDPHEANINHLNQAPNFPFAAQPMQQLGYFQPQHYIWVPVPVMTLPPPQPPAAAGQPPGPRSRDASGDDAAERRP